MRGGGILGVLRQRRGRWGNSRVLNTLTRPATAASSGPSRTPAATRPPNPIRREDLREIALGAWHWINRISLFSVWFDPQATRNHLPGPSWTRYKQNAERNKTDYFKFIGSSLAKLAKHSAWYRMREPNYVRNDYIFVLKLIKKRNIIQKWNKPFNLCVIINFFWTSEDNQAKVNLIRSRSHLQENGSKCNSALVCLLSKKIPQKTALRKRFASTIRNRFLVIFSKPTFLE